MKNIKTKFNLTNNLQNMKIAFQIPQMLVKLLIDLVLAKKCMQS